MMKTRAKTARVVNATPRKSTPSRPRLSYDAAGAPYWDSGKGRRHSGPNSEILAALPTMRARARYLVRNNPHARAAVAKIVRGIIGTGLTPRFQDAAVQELFEKWTAHAWAGNRLGWYAMQETLCRAWIEGGEALARKRWRGPGYGYAVPLQIETLEGDYLDDSRGISTALDGGRVAGGIEFDAIGDPVGYWLLPYHPSDTVLGLTTVIGESRLIPAAECAHLYTPERLGQIRGMTHLTAIIEAISQIADMRLAQRLNWQARSRVVGGIESEAAEYPGGLLGDSTDPADTSDETPDREVLEDLGPAAFVRLLNGEKLTWGPPLSNGADYEPTMTTEDRRVAAGMGLTYEQMSGNLSTVNYSSYKNGLTDARDERRAQRENIYIPAVLDPAIRWFLEAGVVAGKLRSADIPYTWTSPRVLTIDKEQAGIDDMRILNGTSSPIEIIEAGGRSWREVIQERADYKAACLAAGLPDPYAPKTASGAPVAAETPV